MGKAWVCGAPGARAGGPRSEAPRLDRRPGRSEHGARRRHLGRNGHGRPGRNGRGPEPARPRHPAAYASRSRAITWAKSSMYGSSTVR